MAAWNFGTDYSGATARDFHPLPLVAGCASTMETRKHPTTRRRPGARPELEKSAGSSFLIRTSIAQFVGAYRIGRMGTGVADRPKKWGQGSWRQLSRARKSSAGRQRTSGWQGGKPYIAHAERVDGEFQGWWRIAKTQRSMALGTCICNLSRASRSLWKTTAVNICV